MYSKRAFDNRWSNDCAEKIKRHGSSGRRSMWYNHMGISFDHPPANVKEQDDRYELHLFAPGFVKSDFHISLIDQTLSISLADQEESQTIWKRQEYTPKGFTRKFELNEKVDRSTIEASYEQGILIVKLPKLKEFETARVNIEIN